MTIWGYNANDQLGWFTSAAVRAFIGQFNPGTDGTLNSVAWFGSVADAVRIAVYANSSDTIGGADLLEEWETSQVHQSWQTVNSVSNPTLSNGSYLIIAWKGDGSSAIYTNSTIGDGEFTRRDTLGLETDDSTDAWDDPCTIPTASTAGRGSMRLDYTAVSSGGGGIAPRAHFLRSQQGVT